MDKDFEPPFGIQFLVNKETCDSQRVRPGLHRDAPEFQEPGPRAPQRRSRVAHDGRATTYHIWRSQDGTKSGERPRIAGHLRVREPWRLPHRHQHQARPQGRGHLLLRRREQPGTMPAP